MDNTQNKHKYLRTTPVFSLRHLRSAFIHHCTGPSTTTSPLTTLRIRFLSDRTFVDSNLITQGNPTVTASIRSLTVVVDLAFVFRISTGIDASLAVSTCVASLVERLQITENGESYSGRGDEEW